ncbi:hypothetical protein PHPALM_31601 [Phytophthora palmivora]|uniref:Uncharacterized protein n=1 Tax=Phytophthora palmivora TaxID=4796 RepID=A0A2P4X254_9STRA|nr:hypothetical protein PHPALM_31601 [Phytophthora palmivora]
MVKGPLKMKVQVPDSGSESEAQRDADDSDSSVDESSSEADSDVEVKNDEPKRKSDSSSSSSSSGSSDSSASDPSSSSSSDSSASDPSSSDESESEEEKPKKIRVKKVMTKENPKKVVVRKKVVVKKKQKSNSTRLKRLKRMSLSGSSSDEDSEVEVTQPRNTKSSMEIENEESDSDSLREEALGSDTDSERSWQSQDEETAKKRDEIVEDSDEEWCDEEWEDEIVPTDDEDEEVVTQSDILQAKYVMRNITSHVPIVEETAIRRGVKLSGPPLEFATTHVDEFARFSQDPSEILEDYEVLTHLRQPDPDTNEQVVPNESAFAQVPRPMIALAADALRRSSRKRKRTTGSENREESNEHALSAAGLLNIARVGGQFGDHFVESLLTANGKALQGLLDSDFDYDKRCWSSLATKKKPIANWRFVLEHVRRTKGRPDADDAVYPPLKQK